MFTKKANQKWRLALLHNLFIKIVDGMDLEARLPDAEDQLGDRLPLRIFIDVQQNLRFLGIFRQKA